MQEQFCGAASEGHQPEPIEAMLGRVWVDPFFDTGAIGYCRPKTVTPLQGSGQELHFLRSLVCPFYGGPVAMAVRLPFCAKSLHSRLLLHNMPPATGPMHVPRIRLWYPYPDKRSLGEHQASALGMSLKGFSSQNKGQLRQRDAEAFGVIRDASDFAFLPLS